MSRTFRTDMDGTIVRDGKAHIAQNEHNDPWDVGVPYNRAENRRLLKDEILQYVRENDEALTSEIIDHILIKHPDLKAISGSWIVLELLDELKSEGEIR